MMSWPELASRIPGKRARNSWVFSSASTIAVGSVTPEIWRSYAGPTSDSSPNGVNMASIAALADEVGPLGPVPVPIGAGVAGLWTAVGAGPAAVGPVWGSPIPAPSAPEYAVAPPSAALIWA